MLQAIRDRATGWIAYGIIGFLIIPFAFWGIDQYQGGGQIDVAEVNGSEITLQEFQRAYQEQQARLSSLLGAQLDPALLDENQLKRNTLNQLVDNRLLTQVAIEEGYRVGDQLLGVTVRALPAFQTDGRFDSERYEMLLRRQGLTPQGFEEQMRVDMARQQLESGVQATFVATDPELDRLLALVEQGREVAYLRFSLDAYREALTVDEADLATWFEQNQEQFRSPERARILYVELDAETLAAEMPVQEAELVAYYDEQKGRYTRDEERSASHVLARVALDADEEAVEQARSRIAAIADELAAETLSFEEAMAQAAEDPEQNLEAGDLGVIAPGMMDADIEQALFALGAPGEISEPVRSEFGIHLIRLDEIVEGSQVPLEEIEDELRAELQRQRAESEFFELADELSNVAYESPGSLDPAAEAIGAAVQESAWLTRIEGEGVAADPAVRDAVFSDEVLTEGVNSEPVELGSTRLVVVRLLEHQPAALRELAEAREEAELAYRSERARTVIAEESEAALAAARSGQPLEEQVQEGSREWVAPATLRRQGGEAPPSVTATAFALPKPTSGQPEYGSTVLPNGDQAVVELLSVTDGDPAAVDEQTRLALAAQLRQRYGAAQWQSSVDALRARSNIETFPENL